MGKKILVWVACLMTAMLAFAGCAGSYKHGPLSGDFSGDVTSNGGFVVEKGNYVYFINGVESSTSDNTFGTPVKGSLMRASKTDLSNPEIVVPRLMVAGDYTAGFWIYDDYVYYATPTTAKNKAGQVESSYLDFARTKLDGTGTSKSPLFRLETNTTPYRVMKTGDDVCIVYYDSTNKALKSYNVATKKTSAIAENVSAYLFPVEKDSDLIYYSTTVKNEETNANELYNVVYSVKGNGSESKIVLSGIGKTDYNKMTAEEKQGISEPVELQGINFTILKNAGGKVYYSTSVVNASTELVRYYAAGTFTEDVVANVKNATVVTEKAGVLTSTAMVTEYGILYVDSNRGIVLNTYDATNGDSRRFIAGEKAKAATLQFVSGDKLYYSLSATNGFNMYVVSLTENADTIPESKKVTESVFASSWYAPELIGDRLFYASATDRTYKYVYVIDMTKYTEEDYAATMIGKMNEADTKTEEEAKAKDEEAAA